MLSSARGMRSGDTMLQSYNEGYLEIGLSYGHHHPHYHPQPCFNNYIHDDNDNGSSEYVGHGEGKHTPDWSYREPDAAQPPGYLSSQPPPDSGYANEEVSAGLVGPMQMDSPLILQESLIETAPLLQNGHQPAQPQSAKKEEECLPNLDGPRATQIESKKDVLKLPGFHQTFGNITEIGRFSQPDEFFESRPPEIPEPPAKVSESLEVKRKPRGRKRKQPEPRELYPRSEGTGCSAGEGQWTMTGHHWQRPHPYYHHNHHYHHYPPQQYPPQHPQYYHQQHHLDCPPPPPPYHYYQPNHWHSPARDYLHHHSYPGYV